MGFILFLLASPSIFAQCSGGILINGNSYIYDGGTLNMGYGSVAVYGGAGNAGGTIVAYTTVAGTAVTATNTVYLGCAGNYTLTLAGPPFTVTNTGNLLTMGATATGDGVLIIGAPPAAVAATSAVVAPAPPSTISGLNSVVFGPGSSNIVFNHDDTTGTYVFPAALTGPATGGTASVTLLSGWTVFTGASTYTTTADTFTYSTGTPTPTISTANLTYTAAAGTSIAAGATLQLGNGGTTGSITDNMTDGGAVIFDRSDAAAAYAGVISGSGTVTQQGTGTLTLSGANVYSGATTVAAGILQAGAVDTLSAASSVTVASGATLNLAGFNQTVAAVTDGTGATVTLPAATPVPGTTLTSNGDWAGGGTVDLSTTLGDDTSPTDALVIGGDVTGTTTLNITNIDGLGAYTTNGILVVLVDGNSPSTGFVLSGGSITVGTYTYTLNQVGKNWYLQDPQPQVPPPQNPPGNPPGNDAGTTAAAPLDARWMLAWMSLALLALGIAKRRMSR